MRKFMQRLSYTLFLLIFLSTGLNAQSDIQSPTEFLGYELGTQFTPHHKVMDYFWYIAEYSPMARGQKYGETNEGRELMLAYISSEENMDRLEEIRKNNLRRTGLLDGQSTSDSTAIVWLSYNVHGDETSSSEAAMKTIYELVRPGNSETKSWLQNSVVIMDPMINPDGRDRYVHWYKETVGEEPNVHPTSREHHQPWPSGRTNHYYFDLNRDWAWLTQKESRQRVAEYQKWMPHIHVDFHEQGYNDPYYFAPAAKPFHNAITEWQSEFQYTIGKNHAKYFDKNNWLYFTREVFDLFYPSYGDTYPIFNGAIGMTYEQGGQVGLGILKANDDTLTLDDRLTHHHTTGLSTVEISSQHASSLVNEFSRYYERAQNNPRGEYKTYVIKADNNPDKVRALLNLLDEHKIDFGQAASAQRLQGYNYRTGETERMRVTEDDYLISAYQPKSVLARVLFEPRPQLTDSVTYDITAWEQHYAYGLDGYALTQRLEIDSASAPEKEIDNSATGTPYAYLARWKDVSDMRMLADLLKHDVKIRFARDEFKIEDQKYDAGTLIITRGDNEQRGKKFDSLVQKIATNHNQQVDPVATGFVQSGSDFGSNNVRYLERPRVALLSGSGTSANRVGEIWHFFDKQIDYPLTMIDTDYFDSIDLGDYDVLILPAGSYDDKLDEERMKEIRDWASSGGKLIALGEGNSQLVGKEGFGLQWKTEKEKEEEPQTDEGLDNYEDQQRENISSYNAGSVFEIAMDPSHPLAFGYGESYFSLKLDSDAYAYLDSGWNVGVAKEDAHMSGFVGYKAKEDLKNTLAFGVEDMGRGSVVYMVDNPLFRAFWYNGKLLFGNAVFLVGQ